MLTWDRDLLLDALFNADKFAADGIEIDVVYESGLQSNTYAGWLLDPKGSNFGPNAKFFKMDLAEAKKLIIAAGHSDGVVDDFNLYYAAAQASVPAAYSARACSRSALPHQRGCSGGGSCRIAAVSALDSVSASSWR